MTDPASKICQNCKAGFAIEPEDFDFYRKMGVPAPTFCWLCRAQRRFAFRNERALYKRKSSLSGKEIFGTYPEDAPFPVYAQEEWYSDGWDPLSYGRDYDFSKSFFEQYLALSNEVPRPAKSVITITNSEYSNNDSFIKNCYLIFNSVYSEDCAYGNAIDYCRDCYDNSHVRKSEQSYENFWLANCNKTFFSSQCTDCVEVFFSKDLKGCNNCFGCVNLRGKSYCIWNKQYSKEEYFEKIKSFDFGSYKMLENIREEVRRFRLKYPVKYLEGIRNTDVSGAYISHSKNVRKSYLVNEGENLKYCQYMQVPASKECHDHTIWGENTTFTYECAMTGEGTNAVRFCLQSYTSIKNMDYCEYCISSSDLFGCISLRNKRYCILNKQYSKEEYENLVPRIKNQMAEIPYIDKLGREYRYGEFFPAEFSSFPYNETLAHEHFPLTKEATLRSGFAWKDADRKAHTVDLAYAEIPDHIQDATEDILQKTVGCAHEGSCEHGCTGAFRITAPEFQFYKRFNIALPRLCVNCRHRMRIEQRNSLRTYPRHCDCAGSASLSQSGQDTYQNTTAHFHDTAACPNEFETAYAPTRPEIVYCEACYQNEVAG